MILKTFLYYQLITFAVFTIEFVNYTYFICVFIFIFSCVIGYHCFVYELLEFFIYSTFSGYFPKYYELCGKQQIFTFPNSFLCYGGYWIAFKNRIFQFFRAVFGMGTFNWTIRGSFCKDTIFQFQHVRLNLEFISTKFMYFSFSSLLISSQCYLKKSVVKEHTDRTITLSHTNNHLENFQNC